MRGGFADRAGPLDDRRDPLVQTGTALRTGLIDSGPAVGGLSSGGLAGFNNQPVTAVLNGQSVNIDARGWVCHWK